MTYVSVEIREVSKYYWVHITCQILNLLSEKFKSNAPKKVNLKAQMYTGKLTGHEWKESGMSEAQGWDSWERAEVCSFRKMLNTIKEKYAFS